MLFRGTAVLNLDAKGRLAIPVKQRQRLVACGGGQVVVTPDLLDPCLQLYPLPEWETIERKLTALPSYNRQARDIRRRLIGRAMECELDSHGRILLPSELRGRVQIKKRIALVGQGNIFEIWDTAAWERQMAEDSASSGEDLARELALLSL